MQSTKRGREAENEVDRLDPWIEVDIDSESGELSFDQTFLSLLFDKEQIQHLYDCHNLLEVKDLSHYDIPLQPDLITYPKWINYQIIYHVSQREEDDACEAFFIIGRDKQSGKKVYIAIEEVFGKRHFFPFENDDRSIPVLQISYVMTDDREKASEFLSEIDPDKILQIDVSNVLEDDWNCIFEWKDDYVKNMGHSNAGYCGVTVFEAIISAVPFSKIEHLKDVQDDNGWDKENIEIDSPSSSKKRKLDTRKSSEKELVHQDEMSNSTSYVTATEVVDSPVQFPHEHIANVAEKMTQHADPSGPVQLPHEHISNNTEKMTQHAETSVDVAIQPIRHDQLPSTFHRSISMEAQKDDSGHYLPYEEIQEVDFKTEKNDHKLGVMSGILGVVCLALILHKRENLQDYLDFAKSTLQEVKEIGLIPKILVLVEGFKRWISEYAAFVHEDASLFWEAVKLGDYENAFGRLGISVPSIFSERDV